MCDDSSKEKLEAATRSKAPAKRSQHYNATYCNIIVGRIMLCIFGQPLSKYYNILGIVGSNLKLESTTPNKSQCLVTG